MQGRPRREPGGLAADRGGDPRPTGRVLRPDHAPGRADRADPRGPASRPARRTTRSSSYAADNGLALGSHGLLGKQNVFEHSMRVPLIIAGPGHSARQIHRRLHLPAGSVPDPVRRARHPRSAGLEGESLRPLWEGKKERVRDSVFLPFIQIQRAVRDERWKLIAYPEDRPPAVVRPAEPIRTRRPT